MRKSILSKIFAIALGAAVMIGTIASSTLEVKAAHDVKATVYGTVDAGTTGTLLKLKTAQGDMLIKIDGDTNTSACKLLLPDSAVYVDVYYGDDAYMHADKISTTNTGTVSGATDKTSTVTGTIADKPMKDNTIYVNMGDDQMHLKVDATTTYNCGVLYAGKKISAVVYRGTDAYMHALSISDGDYSTGSSSTGATSYYNGSVATTAVTGTVTNDRKDGKLFLKTKDGVYELKFDANTDYSNGYMLVTDKKVTAHIYRGDDACMHIAALTRTGELSGTSSAKSSMTFTGTVSGDSTDGMLLLKTSGGNMKIKLDSNTKASAGVFSGSTVSVVANNCADEYWHADSITVVK